MVGWIEVIILAIIEGITEFLPVSSTGHLIVAADWLGLDDTAELDAFIVIIQGGAILAVITAYRQMIAGWFKGWWSLVSRNTHAQDPGILRHQRNHSLLVALAVVPFGVLGFLNRDLIISLFSPDSVAIALIVGGVVMIGEGFYSKMVTYRERESQDFRLRDALLIGFGQCLSLWPGFSRAAATILAARFSRYSRPAAAELSFIIGLPTIMGTTAYELKNIEGNLDAQWWLFMLVGTLIAWGVAFISVKWLIRFLKKYSLAAFGWYRVVLGAVILIWLG